jgi:hypothetical protein
MELMFKINEIFIKKSDNINDFLYNYHQYTWEKLSKMSDENLKLLIWEIYLEDSKIKDLKNNKRYKNVDFDYILNYNKKDLEKYFDNIFWIMISQWESERAFLYMWYLSDSYWYKFDNFVENYFELELLPDWLIKENVNKFINKLINIKLKKWKINFINNLTSQDFFGQDYFVLDSYTKKIIDIYVSIIKIKLKELYIN